MLMLLNFFPVYVYATLLVLSVVAIVISQILNIRYIQLLAVFTMAVAAFSMGSRSNNDAVEARADKLNSKIEVVEEIQKIKNLEIREKIITKIKYIKEVTDANAIQVEIVAPKLDHDCKLTDAAVLLHNASSQNEVSRSSPGADAGTSEVKASELLNTVQENYGTYYEVVAKLKLWQEWYKQQKELFELAK